MSQESKDWNQTQKDLDDILLEISDLQKTERDLKRAVELLSTIQQKYAALSVEFTQALALDPPNFELANQYLSRMQHIEIRIIPPIKIKLGPWVNDPALPQLGGDLNRRLYELDQILKSDPRGEMERKKLDQMVVAINHLEKNEDNAKLAVGYLKEINAEYFRVATNFRIALQADPPQLELADLYLHTMLHIREEIIPKIDEKLRSWGKEDSEGSTLSDEVRENLRGHFAVIDEILEKKPNEELRQAREHQSQSNQNASQLQAPPQGNQSTPTTGWGTKAIGLAVLGTVLLLGGASLLGVAFFAKLSALDAFAYMIAGAFTMLGGGWVISQADRAYDANLAKGVEIPQDLLKGRPEFTEGPKEVPLSLLSTGPENSASLLSEEVANGVKPLNP